MQMPLETQLAEAARILLGRFDIVITLLGVLRTLPHLGIEGKAPGPPAFVAVANGAINQSLALIFDRHRDRLRIDPARRRQPSGGSCWPMPTRPWSSRND